MLITLALPWQNPADGPDAPLTPRNTTLEVPDDVAQVLLHDGYARAAGIAIDDAEDAEDSDDDAPAPPPRHGHGSGREAWAEYAAALKIEVDEDATRDEIIAALTDAGKPVDAEPAQSATDSPAASGDDNTKE